MMFRDRIDAGRALAEKLAKYAGASDVIVLALPRGGVPVAFEVARNLSAPLDVFVVRKLGVPGQKELAMGAVASGETEVYNDDVIRSAGVSRSDIERVLQAERRELKRRESLYRGDTVPVDVRGKTVIIVDDGLATGATMRAAVAALKKRSPVRIVVAVPVASSHAVEELARSADEVACVSMPEPFWGVGNWYEDFEQTEDGEVRAFLARAKRPAGGRDDDSQHAS